MLFCIFLNTFLPGLFTHGCDIIKKILKYLEIYFNDGVNSKLEIDKIASEFSK